jgi:hypothetical protein
MVLDVYVKGVKIKKLIDPYVAICIFYKKNSWEKKTCVSLHTKNSMFLMRPW